MAAIAGHSMRVRLCTVVGSVLIACVATIGDRANAAAPRDDQEFVGPQPEVVISAPREYDRRTLERVLLPQFIKSHAIASESIGQLSRWRAKVCPETSGLQAVYGEFISRRIVEIARSVGAPTERAGKCQTNVNVIFTPHPQQFLDGIVSNNPMLLGTRGHQEEAGQIRHTIQAFYLVGTRSSETPPHIDAGPSSARPAANGGSEAEGGPSSPAWRSAGGPTTGGGLQIDGEWAPVMGSAGSRLGHSVASEFVHVTVIADANALTNYSLRTIADYVAMLVLTRTEVEQCSPLPSIIDLLSAACRGRGRPPEMTAADLEYLKALYASNLELNINLEQGEMRSRMAQTIKVRSEQ